MLAAIVFLIITFLGYIFALWKGPFWGLIAYANVYFNVPDVRVNWWAEHLPDLRWSLSSTAILLVSMVLHHDKLSRHKLKIIYYIFIFFIYTQGITLFSAVDPKEAQLHSYYLFAYGVISTIIVKSIVKFEHLRLFLLTIIMMAAYLVFLAHIEGSFIDGRLNNIGPNDANQANEFGILLATIIPFTFPFLFYGKRYEKAICLSSLLLIFKGLIMTVSRGAFLSLVLAVVYSFIFIANQKLKAYILIMGICFISVFLVLAPNNIVERISTLWTTDTSTEESKHQLSSGRWTIWQYGINMSLDYPFGIGPEGFKAMARHYMPPEVLTFHPGAEYGIRSAHSSYLQVLVEQGYIGICIFMIICLGTMYILFRDSKKIKQLSLNGTFRGLLILSLNISFFCGLMGGIFNSRIYYEFFWWQIAIIMVSSSFINQQHSSEENIVRH